MLLIAGKPVPYCLARIPQGGEVRGNLAAGGKGVAQPLSDSDWRIARQLGPQLAAKGLLLVGLYLLFIAGIGAHFEGGIKEHTKHVLDVIEKQLAECGSSMDKVLKCNVYLNDLKDYKEMNETFKGRFGDDPPVRTTIAAAGGIPGDSLVEIDVIAYI